MKVLRLIALFIIGASLLTSCNKVKHWETKVAEITNITSYSAEITLDYNFDGKTAKANIGVDIGLVSGLDTLFTSYSQEENNNESFTIEPSQFIANQIYYVRSFMTRKRDTIWSEVESFKTLEDYPLSCDISKGEVYFSSTDTTMIAGNLVKIESITNPELYTYEAEISIGKLTFSFLEKPWPGLYHTLFEVYQTYDTNPLVLVGFWFDNGNTNCYYEAGYYKNIHVSRDIDNHLSISFCDLEITKMNSGSCANSQIISGFLVD